MSLTVAIVGHTSRTAAAAVLAEELAPAAMFLDDGTLGEWANHRRALAACATSDATHALILQDDALPVTNLLEHATRAVKECPQDLIGLYVGRSRPLAPQVAIAVHKANEHGASWLTHDKLLWGVGLLLPVHAIWPLLKVADQRTELTDKRIGIAWRKSQSRNVLYTWPSLVDHADGAQVTTDHPVREPGRFAHQVGVPNWASIIVRI